MMNCNNSSQYTDIINQTECLENISTLDDWKPPKFDASVENILLAITLTVLDLVTCFGNLLVIMAFVLEKKLLQPFNMFILNLAVTDFLVAISAMTFYTIDTLFGYWPFGHIMCGVWIYFDFAMTFASVFTLVAISIDRFWCVTWAIHYRMHNNKNKTAIVIAIIWFCVIAIWTPPFIGDRLKHSEKYSCIWEPHDNTEFVIFVAVVGHYIPCVIMVLCYVKVFTVMRRQSSVGSEVSSANVSVIQNTSVIKVNIQPVSTIPANCSYDTAIEQSGPRTERQKQDNLHINVHSLENMPSNHITHSRFLSTGSASNSQNSPPPRPGSMADFLDPHPRSRGMSKNRANQASLYQNRERRIFITLTYVVSCYLICWFPFYIAFDIYAWKPHLVPAGLYSFFFWMTYVNSTLNPFIYAYTSKDFRGAFIKVLKMFIKCSK